MSKNCVLFGTSGQYIAGSSEITDGSNLAVEMAQCQASLYISTVNKQILLATVLSVKRENSRNHEIVYVETDDLDEFSLKNISDFYGRAVKYTLKNGYEINDVGFKELSLFTKDMINLSDKFESYGSITKSDRLSLSYILGKYISGKKSVVKSDNLVSSIICLVRFIDVMRLNTSNIRQSCAIAKSDINADVLISSSYYSKNPDIALLDKSQDITIQIYQKIGDYLYKSFIEKTYRNDGNFLNNALLSFGTSEEYITKIEEFCKSEGILCPCFSYSLNDADIQLFSETYTGKSIIPEITISKHGKKLRENRDYEIALPKSMVDAGEYIIKICGCGKYDGMLEKKWNIKPFELNQKNTDVKVSVKKYNGERLHVETIVKVKHEKLIEGSNYKISGESDGTDIKTYSACIEGIGNYCGAVHFDWKIEPEKRSIFSKTNYISDKNSNINQNNCNSLGDDLLHDKLELNKSDQLSYDDFFPSHGIDTKSDFDNANDIKSKVSSESPETSNNDLNIKRHVNSMDVENLLSQSNKNSLSSEEEYTKYIFDENRIKFTSELMNIDSNYNRHSCDFVFYKIYISSLMDVINNYSFKYEQDRHTIIEDLKKYNENEIFNLNAYVMQLKDPRLKIELEKFNAAYETYQKILNQKNPEYLWYIIIKHMIREK